MFVTLRLYRVNPIFEREFIRLWNDLVKSLKEEGALDHAILHKESKISFVSYVSWNTKKQHEEMLESPPKKIRKLIRRVEECCNSITILHRMEVIEKTILP